MRLDELIVMFQSDSKQAKMWAESLSDQTDDIRVHAIANCNDDENGDWVSIQKYLRKFMDFEQAGKVISGMIAVELSVTKAEDWERYKMSQED
jgi:hypothetical protein